MMEELEHMSHPVVIEIKVLDDQSMTNGDSRSLKTAKIVADYEYPKVSNNILNKQCS